ncbi:hypothetical protein DEU34_2283 [Microbacterium sp. AG1240]|nr:hypothetical protein DEU34_2283 [Microbacterium sp. AG1240]
MQVRGMVRLPVSGAVSRIDFEVPFNAVVSYRAELFDGAGVSLGFTDPAVLGETFSGLAPSEELLPGSLYPEESLAGAGVISPFTWMHNPLAPEGAVRVSMSDSAAAEISRPTPGAVVYPRGRRVGVMVSEPRRGLSGFVADVYCDSLEDADRVQAMLGDYNTTTVPVLCIRPGLDFNARITAPLFLGVSDIVEEGLTVRWGGSDLIQRISGDEVSPPVPGLFIPLLTYADLNAYYSTYAAFNSDNASYLAASRRYELAGSADA